MIMPVVWRFPHLSDCETSLLVLSITYTNHSQKEVDRSWKKIENINFYVHLIFQFDNLHHSLTLLEVLLF